jgi:hypothetical protein
VADVVRQRAELLGDLAEPALKQRAEGLRDEMGKDAYERLVAQARESGYEITTAVAGDYGSLRLLATRARYLAAYRASAPKG